MTIISKSHRGLIVASMVGIGSIVLGAADIPGPTAFRSNVRAETMAPASPQCGDRATLLVRLAKEFSEGPTAIGYASNGGVVELLLSPSGSWTLIITYGPQTGTPGANRTCLIATGDGWEWPLRKTTSD